MNSEPLVTVASLTAAVSALLALLVAFGLDLTDGQNVAIMGAVGVLAPLVVAWAARGKVMPAWKLRDPLPPTE